MNSASERSDVVRGVSELFDELSAVISPLRHYRWNASDSEQQWEFVRRSAIIRQFEALESTIGLTKIGRGHFGVALVRPAFEELVWIDYLRKNENSASEMLTHLARKELRDTLGAQADFLNVAEMHKIGLSMRRVKQILAALANSSSKLVDFGKKLGWRRDAALPSMSWLCNATKRTEQYNYLYHATSRYVHFSTHELLRRVWGGRGSVEISSSHFSAFWTDFALYWSLRILVETIEKSGVDRRTLDAVPKLHERIEALRQVQMVTATELESWDKPTPAKSTH